MLIAFCSFKSWLCGNHNLPTFIYHYNKNHFVFFFNSVEATNSEFMRAHSCFLLLHSACDKMDVGKALPCHLR